MSPQALDALLLTETWQPPQWKGSIATLQIVGDELVVWADYQPPEPLAVHLCGLCGRPAPATTTCPEPTP